MGTAFINFYFCGRLGPDSAISDDITVEIGKIVFRSIIEAMELERPGDADWKLSLDAAYGIKYLHVANDYPKSSYDYGPAFLRAIRYIRENGPPDYYPKRDMNLLHEQLNLLEETYLKVRSLA